MRKYLVISVSIFLIAFVLLTFIVEAKFIMPTAMAPIPAMAGILMAFIIAIIAALFFPAETQSKIWIQILGTEWGATGSGRIWTFISVLIVVALLWAFLIWLPPNY